MSEWISVNDKLPENEERVLICAKRKRHTGEIIQIRTIGMYHDGTMPESKSAYCWDGNNFEYSEALDDTIISEGWFEQHMYCELFGTVGDFVTHWMPLPNSPILNKESKD